ncbi:NERD domain-containing protein [Viridibacillus arvi]|uniref:NERD domain-containing protein n=1 Tax=Viridibacillus arvi TaxID=263475 RepID=UPI0034CD5B45
MGILYKDIEYDGLYEGYEEKNHFQEKGEEGERKVRDELVNSLSDSYSILNSVYTRTEEGDFTEIDHIVLHPKFILCIETKYYSGELDVIDAETWGKRSNNGEYTKIDSPQQQAVHHAYSLKSYLESIGIHMTIYTIVVLVNHKSSSYNRDTDQFYKSECPVIFKKDLAHLIEIIEKQSAGSYPVQHSLNEIADQIIDEHEGIKSSQLFWYKKLAMKDNDREAQYQLGKMYLSGYYQEEGRLVQVKQNEKAAIFWLSKASKKGHKLARQSIRQHFQN